tara:strand:+ start:378 stop:701 length:324 start_codon:yes stop_codon:yes gene_type:complete
MLKKTILSLSLGLFVFSCTDLERITDSLKQIEEKQNLILSRLNKLNKIEKDLADISKDGPKPNTDNKKKNEKPKADPNKVYNIAESGSIVLGNPDAAISIIKWTDFQ